MSAIAYGPRFEASLQRLRAAKSMDAADYAWDMINRRTLRLRRLHDGSWDRQPYALTLSSDGTLACSCPDFAARGRALGPCKHIWRLHLDARRYLPADTIISDAVAFCALRDSLIVTPALPAPRRAA